MNSVMAEMVNIISKEKVLLEQCQGLLSRVAAMQVKQMLSPLSAFAFNFILLSFYKQSVCLLLGYGL